MSFSDEIRRLIDSQLAAKQVEKPYVGTVIEQTTGNSYSVLLDGSSVPIICTRPRHIRANVGGRVVVLKTMARYTIIAELGGVPPQPMVFDEEGTNITGFTNTGYSTTIPVCGVSFIAPSSGQGMFYATMRSDPNTANAISHSVHINNGPDIAAGTTFAGGTDAHCYTGTAVIGADASGTVARPVSGLTPGAEYNAFVVYKITGGNGDIFDRAITWVPDNVS